MNHNQRVALFAGGLLLVACGTAYSSDWVSMGESGGQEYSLDRSSILNAGNSRKVWMKMVMKPHSIRGQGSSSKTWVTYVLAHMVFDCKEETQATELLKAYFEDGTNDTSPMYVQGPQPVAPDTANRQMLDYVCAFKR